MSGLHINQPTVVLHGHNTALVCSLDGQIAAEETQGFFAGDTRLISTYKFAVNGCAWRLLARTRSGHGTAHWQFQNPELRDELGDLPAGSLAFSLRRRVAGALHDDLAITSFAMRPVRLHFTLQLDADFADLFEVKSRSIPPRMDMLRRVEGNRLDFVYETPGFRRGLRVRLDCPAQPDFTGTPIGFDLTLEHGQQWTCCLEAVPELDHRIVAFAGDPHRDERIPPESVHDVRLECGMSLQGAFERGRADLRALALDRQQGEPITAAGAPWFLALFGRDALVTALMSGIAGVAPTAACLTELARLQGRQRDDFRDEEPGKILHELRCDELTHRGSLPFSPYFGTHDAPALYCLALWHAWRWGGDEALLDECFEPARLAMRWCDELGDPDGDGFLEYATRSPKGYRNQGWKDSADAIVDAQGRQAGLPLATVELQGYLFAARLAFAELCDARGREQEAGQMRTAAAGLRQRVEERFWLERENFYALALDGDKRSVDAIASNPGHLLWSGLPSPERAARVARRLLEPDLFSGWGLRTLSMRNPAYNPLSYQLGSVWPHDTLIASAGLWRYGLREQAATLIHGILRAAEAFEDDRLPELFCGFDAGCGFPVPYENANIPQAWAAAVPLLMVQLFLGIVPDAPRKRCFVDPWLPEWLPRMRVSGIGIGEGTLEIEIVREGSHTRIADQRTTNLAVIHGRVEAPLMGMIPTIKG